MAWARIEGTSPRNRKIAALSDRAYRVYHEAICWCVEELTDGLLPSDVSTSTWTTVRRPNRAIEELMERGLFEITSGGLQIHDYNEYQPRAEKILAEREEAKKRMADKRAAGKLL